MGRLGDYCRHVDKLSLAALFIQTKAVWLVADANVSGGLADG